MIDDAKKNKQNILPALTSCQISRFHFTKPDILVSLPPRRLLLAPLAPNVGSPNVPANNNDVTRVAGAADT